MERSGATASDRAVISDGVVGGRAMRRVATTAGRLAPVAVAVSLLAALGATASGATTITTATAPTTASPDIVSATITKNGFATGHPSVVQVVFDKPITLNGPSVNPNLFGAIGPDTTNNSSSVPSSCVIDANGKAVDCQFPSTTDIAANSLFEVDGGAIASANGTLPNVLGLTTLGGGNSPTFLAPKLKRAAVTSAAFNQITFTFDQPVKAPVAHLFGFTTRDGQTEDLGNKVSPPSGDKVTVTFPTSSSVRSAEQFFVVNGAVKGRSSGNKNPDMSMGTPPAHRPNLKTVAGTSAPSQFLFTVDRPSVVVNPGDFLVYPNEGAGTPIPATSVSAMAGSTMFLATFSALTPSTSRTVVLGSITQTSAAPGGAALDGLATPNAGNAVGSDAVTPPSPGVTPLANGPLLQTFSGAIGSAQGTFTFDEPIASGTVIPTDFFVVENSGQVAAGASLISVTGDTVIVKFPSTAITALSVGGGLIGPFEAQPGVNGGLTVPTGAAKDTSGDPAVGGTAGGTSS